MRSFPVYARNEKENVSEEKSDLKVRECACVWLSLTLDLSVLLLDDVDDDDDDGTFVVAAAAMLAAEFDGLDFFAISPAVDVDDFTCDLSFSLFAWSFWTIFAYDDDVVGGVVAVVVVDGVVVEDDTVLFADSSLAAAGVADILSNSPAYTSSMDAATLIAQALLVCPVLLASKQCLVEIRPQHKTLDPATDKDHKRDGEREKRKNTNTQKLVMNVNFEHDIENFLSNGKCISDRLFYWLSMFNVSVVTLACDAYDSCWKVTIERAKNKKIIIGANVCNDSKKNGTINRGYD